MTQAEIIDSIIDRLILILSTSPLLTTVTDEFPLGSIPNDELPYTVVSDNRAISYDLESENLLLVTREFDVELFHSVRTNDARRNKEQVAEARQLLTTLPKLLYRNRRLRDIEDNTDTGLRFVRGSFIASDLGIGHGGWRDTSYIGTVLTVTVQYEVYLDKD